MAPLSKAFKRKLATVAELGPGILVEDKGYSLALHYRLAPEKGPAVLAAVADDLRRALPKRPSKFCQANWSWMSSPPESTRATRCAN